MTATSLAVLPLKKELRNQLEKVVKIARQEAEVGARAVLEQYAISESQPFEHLSPNARDLRVHLRARARQLGDRRRSDGCQDIEHLIHECAYEHWHEMLFARFLAENNLLMHPEGVPVSLEECEELAEEEGVDDGWEVAARYAARMLPQIFRPDAPVLQFNLSPECRRQLEDLLESLPPEVFTANDSLGWVYQFWQAQKKGEINQSEVKIGADELPAVTQLFTESYMVDFLLHNTGPGSGVRILNRPAPPPFQESVRCAEQNLYARSSELVGDRDPRAHEFTVQLRAFDTARSGAQVGVAVALSLCSALLQKHSKGGLAVVGTVNLGGSIEPVHTATSIAELAVEKGATTLLMPVTCRKQLYDLSDDMATKVDVQFYSDVRDALLKAIVE